MEDAGGMNNSSTDRGGSWTIIGLAKSFPTVLTTDGVKVSGLSDCAIEAASGSISFGHNIQARYYAGGCRLGCFGQ